ncbi:hypothetical protein DAI22_01g029208 [Oryza sativa Japonica Group]|nr:hypothetical protein DAI22_01g029208 [Oryza sativa Japonica Group]
MSLPSHFFYLLPSSLFFFSPSANSLMRRRVGGMAAVSMPRSGQTRALYIEHGHRPVLRWIKAVQYDDGLLHSSEAVELARRGQQAPCSARCLLPMAAAARSSTTRVR